jgi:hypothetical protein
VSFTQIPTPQDMKILARFTSELYLLLGDVPGHLNMKLAEPLARPSRDRAEMDGELREWLEREIGAVNVNLRDATVSKYIGGHGAGAGQNRSLMLLICVGRGYRCCRIPGRR